MAVDAPIQITPPPKGIYVPAPTFFSHGGSPQSTLNLDTQCKHTKLLVEGGIRGLVLLGSTGEAIAITSAERQQLIRSQRDFLDSHGYADRLIIAGTTAQDLEGVLDQIKISKDAGAAYAMVLAPGYFASVASQSGIKQWFTAVAAQSPLPILIYHYPGVTNNLYIAPKTIEELAVHHNVVGAKLSHAIIDDQILITTSALIDHNTFHTFTGLGQTLLPFLSIGGAGAIDGLAGIFPKTVVRLFELCIRWRDDAQLSHTARAGVLQEAHALQAIVCEGEKLVARWGVVGIKEALARVWKLGDGTAARLPLTGGFPGVHKEWQVWEEVFSKLTKIEAGL